jgi:uncharacterized protein (TIGR03118 family)
MKTSHWSRLSQTITGAICLGLATSASAQNGPPQHYEQTNLVSDIPGLAPITDTRLANPWGLARSATSPWWVADNGTGLSTLYNGVGAIQGLVVTVPAAPGATAPSAPTGIIFNTAAADFLVAPGQPARFIFATLNGTISAWNSGATAVQKVPNTTGSAYTGLTNGSNNGANFLYAANFAQGRIDVFDRTYGPVALNPDAFTDPEVPSSFVPFNVQNIGGLLYVTYSKNNPSSIDRSHGPGKGYVSVFNTAGVLQRRLEWGAWFNAPWGVVQAPADFGGFSGMILVGQFGSGTIAAFDPVSGEFRGLMRESNGRTMAIEKLWALSFGNGAAAGPSNVLYFTAGIEDEAHGLFGTLTPLPEKKKNGKNSSNSDE